MLDAVQSVGLGLGSGASLRLAAICGGPVASAEVQLVSARNAEEDLVKLRMALVEAAEVGTLDSTLGQADAAAPTALSRRPPTPMTLETAGRASAPGGGFCPEAPRNLDRPDLESSVQLQAASFRGSASSRPGSVVAWQQPPGALGNAAEEPPFSAAPRRPGTPAMLLETESLGTAASGLQPEAPRNVDRPDLESSVQLHSASFRGSAASRPSSAPGSRAAATAMSSGGVAEVGAGRAEDEVPLSTSNKRPPTPLLATESLGVSGGLHPEAPRNVDRPDLESSVQLMSASFRGSAASRPTSAAGARPGSPSLRPLEALDPGPLRPRAASAHAQQISPVDTAGSGCGSGLVPTAPVSPATPPQQRSARARMEAMKRRPGSSAGSAGEAGSAAVSSAGSAPGSCPLSDGLATAPIGGAPCGPPAPRSSDRPDLASSLDMMSASFRGSAVAADRAMPVPPAPGDKRTPPRPSITQRNTRPVSAPGARPATQGRRQLPQFAPFEPSIAGEGWVPPSASNSTGFPSSLNAGYPDSPGSTAAATAAAVAAAVAPCTPTYADRKIMMGRSGRSTRNNVLAARRGPAEDQT